MPLRQPPTQVLHHIVIADGRSPPLGSTENERAGWTRQGHLGLDEQLAPLKGDGQPPVEGVRQERKLGAEAYDLLVPQLRALVTADRRL
ncbi:hypothetical protein [Micromonospora sp. NPDC002717]|uniref:hypothetical protein n=1 Tax=Micromonospora sp. NPDC002717 TaxID=3154424 RepID=UPI00331A2AA3